MIYGANVSFEYRGKVEAAEPMPAVENTVVVQPEVAVERESGLKAKREKKRLPAALKELVKSVESGKSE